MKANFSFNGHLSPLESEILKVLWPGRKLKVREVYSKLKGKRKLALTSVAVLLDRLYDKGIVNRKIETGRGGIRYIYFPNKDKKEFEKSVVEAAVNSLISKFGSTAVNYFNERFKVGK